MSMSSDQWKSKISSLMSEHKFLLSHLWRVLVWEKPFFPIITFLSLTIFFWIIAISKASVITTLAVIGILITFIDAFGPSAYPSLVQQLGSERESDYDSACAFLALPIKLSAKGIEKLIELKRRQKVVLCGSVAGVLLISSLVGRVNNIYICYMAAMAFFMAPGALKKAGINLDDGLTSSSSSSGSGFGSTSPTGVSGPTIGAYGSTSFSPSTSSTPVKPTVGLPSTNSDEAPKANKSNDDDD